MFLLQVYREVQYDTPARGGDRCKLVVGGVRGNGGFLINSNIVLVALSITG